MQQRRRRTPQWAMVVAGATAVGLVSAGCGVGPVRGLGEPVAAATQMLSELDWNNATYASVCGLGNVEVIAGVGEGSAVGDVFGVEVIDVAYGDLDGLAGEEAVLLVDCLGGDGYRPHMLVVSPQGVLSTNPAVLAPHSGGSLALRDRPIGVEVGPGDAIAVTVEHHDVEVVHQLGYATAVLKGAEIPVAPGGTAHGVLAAVEEADPDLSPGVHDILVVAVAPDDGHRVAVPPGLAVVDPDTGQVVGLDAMLGRGVRVSIDGEGMASEITVLPSGGA